MKSSGAFRVVWVLLVSLLVASPRGAAGNGGEPAGADVRAIAISPSNLSTVYAGTFGDGVFKSNNGGATWTAINSGLTNLFVNAIVLDPTSPSTAYAGTSGGVFKSTAGGASWMPKNVGLPVATSTLAIDPVTPTTLYAVEFGGVFKSTNGGESWEQKSVGLVSMHVRHLLVDPLTPTTLYVGVFGTGARFLSGGGVYKSVNAAESWNLTGYQRQTGAVLAIDPTQPSTLYAGSVTIGTPFSPFFFNGDLLKSTDGGDSWQIADVGLPTSPSLPFSVYAISVDPVAPTTLYLGTNKGVFKSPTGGIKPPSVQSAWFAANEGLPDLSVRSIAVNPVTPTTLYAGTAGDGVYKSTDAGATWEPTGQGEESGLIENQENPLFTINICAVDRTGRVRVGGRVGLDATTGEDVFVSRGNRNQSVALVLGDGSFEGASAPGFAQAGQRLTVAVRFPAGKISLLSTCRLPSAVGNRR